MLREHLERDAPAREASVARFMVFATAASAVLALLLNGLIGWRLSIALAVMLGAMAGWYAVQLVLLKRGWFHPAVPWINVALEVSAPALIFIVDLFAQGAEYALTAPPLAIWGTLVGLSALRGSRPLAVTAGLLAAAEYAALYAFLASPRLPSEVWVTLQPPLIATRCFLLCCAGLVTAAFVGHFNRRAAEALAAVRAKDVLGKYLLGERIGVGGMAEVFRANYSPEGGFEKTVAVKRVLPAYAEDQDFVALFRQEASLCSRLNHPNIVQVLDFGRFADTYFLAMEYVEGLTLKRLLDAHRGRGLPLPAVTYVGHELLRALDYVHHRTDTDGKPMKLVHRDVNPPNVLVSRLGEVKLTDFGIARAQRAARVTQAGLIKGKPGYLAPEQLEDGELDGRTDLFAVGITLHELLTGVELFSRGISERELLEVYELPIRPPSKVRPEVPKELDEIVLRLLERDIARRTPRAGIAADALAALEGPAAMAPEGQRQLAAAVKYAANVTKQSGVQSKADAETLPATSR
ncbi:MAG: serine/threonine-protein kinase [Myxococcota bacterium]